jgi:hypothetical protein
LWLYRYIFDSTEQNCQGNVTDHFVVPIHQCIGPFGPPRPWGTLSLV